MQVETGYCKITVPPGYLPLMCETCNLVTNRVGPIALFQPEDLSVPMTAGMFKGLDDKHGFPHPFQTIAGRDQDTATWEAARCPRCGKRPFNHRDKVLVLLVGGITEFYEIGSKNVPHAPTIEDERQKEINRMWGEHEEDSLTLSEKRQREIDRIFAEEEHETHEHTKYVGNICPVCIKDGVTTPVVASGERPGWTKCLYHGLQRLEEEKTLEEKNQEEIHELIVEQSEQFGESVVDTMHNVNNAIDKVLKEQKLIKAKPAQTEEVIDEAKIDKLVEESVPIMELKHTSQKKFRKQYPDRCIYCARKVSKPGPLKMHEKSCSDNPKNKKKGKWK